MNRQLSTTDFGLIGHPLAHSFSKSFFTDKFAREGLNLSYDNFDLPSLDPQALYALVLLNPKLRGFNVTAPYKEKIMDFLDKISDEARNIGAVNTVRIQRAADGRVLALEGFNTDLTGFSESIAPLISGLPATAGALILGTGGASKAAAEAMRRFNRKFLKVSRTKSGDGLVTYSEITPELLAEYPIIINATPAGTYPAVDSCPPFPVELLGEGNVVFDMVYNPAETKLMHQAASRGARTKNGLEMLHRQALASFDIWNK